MQNIPLEARPREKLLSQGAHALSDAELLSLLLRTGISGCNVLSMSQMLLNRCGGLSGLLHAPSEELSAIKGLGGPAKRAQLLAVMELARRGMGEQLRKRQALNHPTLVREYLQMQLGHKAHECFGVLFLDSQHQLLEFEVMFRGTLNQTSVYPREVALRALHHHAASVVLSHNHPSGHTQPSAADVQLTRQLIQALGLLEIRVLDHVIVTQGRSLSMAEEGLMPAA